METSKLITYIREIYGTNERILLHEPSFGQNEKDYVLDTLESTFVSSVGKYVDDFEDKIGAYTGATKAVAVVNGTAALSTALYLAGVQSGDLVITQSLTFVATCNALHHMGAEPVFVDVSRETLGLCPAQLEVFLAEQAGVDSVGCYLRSTGQRIRAVVPMHTFGHPVQMDKLLQVCEKWGIVVVEDAAESLGSFYKERHTGTFGEFAAISFNGNKIITTGGGGIVLCADQAAGQRAKHITTTAKVPHPYEFIHDEPGFNYRLPNLNAALGCGQLESLSGFLAQKRRLASLYKDYFSGSEYQFVDEPQDSKSNFWLNAIICEDKIARDNLIEQTNKEGVMTRPIWQLMHKLPMFKSSKRGTLTVSEWLQERVVNLPSSPVEC